MNRLSRQHWTFAFFLALATHLAVYLFSINLPGSAPVYRGGGSFDHGGKQSRGAAGVFVQLGKSGESSGPETHKAALKEQAPAKKPRESLSQAFVAGQDKTGSDARETAPAEPSMPAGKPKPEPTVNAPARKVAPATQKLKQEKTPEATIASAPAPKRKPTRPNLMPEMETLGRRLSVQGPAQTTPSKSKSDEKTISSLAFINRGGKVGTASGNRTGEVRALNYEDQVLLWLKRHGAYPYEAAMYRLEDTVTLKFAINREGKILYYELTKKSQWHLLNLAVERMMRRSSPVPPIPPEIKMNQMTFTIPVHFDPHPRS